MKVTRNPRCRRVRSAETNGVRTRRKVRAVDKAGHYNVTIHHVAHKSLTFMKDIFNTLVDGQWRYTLTVFALSFFLCWTGFALLWWLVAAAHGDLNLDENGQRLDGKSRPCVEGTTNFAGFLLLSIETQVSIGYGLRYPNEECPEAIFLLVMQVVAGIGIQGAMVGIIYAKMIRPSKRLTEVIFSKIAVICQRDGHLCLMFRVCDPRYTHIICSDIKAYLLENKLTPEGERLKSYQSPLRLESDGHLLLLWPVAVVHVIDEDSPFYDLSAKDLLEKKFEVIVTFSGSSSATGQLTQSRTSYLPREILWGHRFQNLLRFDEGLQCYVADCELLNRTYAFDTPLCSAKRLDEVMQEVNDFEAHYKSQEYVDVEHSNSQDISNNTDNTGGFSPLDPLMEDEVEENIFDYFENSIVDIERRNSSDSYSSDEFIIGHTRYKDGLKHTIV
ncbi:inward rectifier potassium channel 2-like [Ctenocephalides felis]|uniref:inward rectifier potassium channel 2-like n=1 Tax=Ctenocephalides felis TaxID=7515 RepID=UPI000E6E5276|nr:inward rectifier potassium channel 2-like [Ctenocephalides felis]